MVSGRLLLFDIDGTLLHTGGAGMRAFKVAIEAVFGRPVPMTRELFAGKLDCVIFESLHAKSGLPAPDRAGDWEAFKAAYLGHLKAEAKAAAEWKVYPGVVSFLEAQKRHSAFALLTGNIRGGAEIKLSTLGLMDYFHCGGFGESAVDRKALAAEALAAARLHHGRDFCDVWVIGDTVADIECGKSIGARTLGVRTGFSRAGELEAAGADRVVATLGEIEGTF